MIPYDIVHYATKVPAWPDSADVPVARLLRDFTAVVFGLAPALQTVQTNMVEPLKDSGRGVIGGFRRGKLRSTLVVAEVALSLVLLTGAGLLMRNFVRLQTLDLGFDPVNVLVARLPFPPGQYTTAAAKPWISRAAISAPADGASAHSAEAALKRPSPPRKSLRRPKRSARLPAVSRKTASASA